MDVGTPARFEAVPVPAPPGGPLVVELVPAPDPWDVARRLAHLPYLLFLDSAERHDERGRYSYVAADPTRWQTARPRNDLDGERGGLCPPFAWLHRFVGDWSQ